MSDTFRYVEGGAFDREHWERFSVQSVKHLTRDRRPSNKIDRKCFTPHVRECKRVLCAKLDSRRLKEAFEDN